jgi:hypothetical protein
MMTKMNDSLSAPLSDVARSQPTHEEISNRAQQIWEALGRPADRDMEIWLQAERELQPSEAMATTQPASASVEDRSATAEAVDVQAFPAQSVATPRKTAKRSSKSAAR